MKYPLKITWRIASVSLRTFGSYRHRRSRSVLECVSCGDPGCYPRIRAILFPFQSSNTLDIRSRWLIWIKTSVAENDLKPSAISRENTRKLLHWNARTVSMFTRCNYHFCYTLFYIKHKKFQFPTYPVNFLSFSFRNRSAISTADIRHFVLFDFLIASKV